MSAVYETDPVGGPEQPDYLNAVLTVRTSLVPIEYLRSRISPSKTFTAHVRFVGVHGPSTSTSSITATLSAMTGTHASPSAGR